MPTSSSSPRSDASTLGDACFVRSALTFYIQCFSELSVCLEEDKVKRDAEKQGQREAEKRRKDDEEKETARKKEADMEAAT